MAEEKKNEKETIDLTKKGFKVYKLKNNLERRGQLKEEFELLEKNMQDFRAKYENLRNIKEDNEWGSDYLAESVKVLITLQALNKLFSKYEWEIYEKNTKENTNNNNS